MDSADDHGLPVLGVLDERDAGLELPCDDPSRAGRLNGCASRRSGLKTAFTDFARVCVCVCDLEDLEAVGMFRLSGTSPELSL